MATAKETPVELQTPEGTISGMLTRTLGATGALLMVGGAGGGTQGPAGVYTDLAERLADVGIASLRLDYRHPNDLDACVVDTLAGVAALQQLGIERVALLGWSFGGAVVITAGALSPAVVGVATVASQTYGTGAVSRLAPRSLLLLHGTGDTVLPDRCSRDLYGRAGEPKELVLYPNDNHGITMHRTEMLDALATWAERVLSPTSPSREAGTASSAGQNA